MCSPLRFLVLCVLAALLPLPPVLADDTPAPTQAGVQSPVAVPESAPSTGARPADTPRTAETAPPPPAPRRERDEMGEQQRLLRSAMWVGAGVGLTVGLINGHHEVESTLIGAASPYAIYLALGLLGSIRPPGMLRERPAEAQILGAPLRGKLGQVLPRALGLAVLGLAADRVAVGEGSAGGRGSARPMLQYTIRW